MDKKDLQINKLTEKINNIYNKYNNPEFGQSYIEEIINKFDNLGYKQSLNLIKNKLEKYKLNKKINTISTKKNINKVDALIEIKDKKDKLIKKNKLRKATKKLNNIINEKKKDAINDLKTNIKNKITEDKINKLNEVFNNIKNNTIKQSLDQIKKINPRNKFLYEDQTVLNFVRKCKIAYERGLKNVTIPMEGELVKTKNSEYYTIPLSWLLNNKGEFEIKTAYVKILKHREDPANFKDNIMNFEEVANNNISRKILGSDQYENLTPDYDKADFGGINFDDIDLTTINGNDDISLKIYNQINEETLKNCCFYNSLRYYNIIDDKTKNINLYYDIIKYLNENKLNYRVYRDDFKIKIGEEKNYINFEERLVKNIKEVKTIFRRFNPDYNIIDEKINNPDNKTLIFAITRGINTDHIFIPEPKLLYVDHSLNKIYEFDEKNNKMIYKDKVKEKYEGQRLIFYDIETCKNFKDNANFKNISHSITYIDITEKKKLKDYTEQELIEILDKNKSFVINYDVNLYKDISTLFRKKYLNLIISFNGAKFDNIFLFKSLKQNNKLCEISINNGMVELQNNYNDLYHYKTYDLKRFLGPGDLQTHSNNYIKNDDYRKKKIDLFDKLDHQYNNNILFEDKDFLNQLEDYNNIDVISLGLIFRSFSQAICNITKDNSNEKLLISSLSLPHFSYKYFQKCNVDIKRNDKPKKFKHINNENIERDIIFYQFLSKFKVGGRCQVNKTIAGFKNNIETKGLYNVVMEDIVNRSLDVASLYPFVMMLYNKSYFMSGDLIYTDIFINDKLGVYHAQVKQNQKDDEILYFCNKTKSGNDWNVKDEYINVILTSEEIKYILNNKPHWEYKIINGFYTKNKIRGIDLFKSLLPFLIEKTKQDEYKQNKDNNYNPVLREVCKSIMNSLSGKFLQTTPDFNFTLDNNFNIQRILKDKAEFELESIKKDKMIHIGLFIYSYSKIYMYENIFQDMKYSDFVYTDTDSCKMVSDKVFKKWYNLRGKKKIINFIWPEVLNLNLGYSKDTELYYNNNGVKCIGQFEDEYAGCGFDKAIYCDKKEYMVYNSKTLKNKIMIKGVQKDKFLIIDDNKDLLTLDIKGKSLINLYYQYKKNIISYDEYNDLNIEERGKYHLITKLNDEIYNKNDIYIMLDDRIKEQSKNIINNCEKLLMNKLNNKKTYILTSSFKRSIYKQNVRREFIIKCI